jgi:hypothetical protein
MASESLYTPMRFQVPLVPRLDDVALGRRRRAAQMRPGRPGGFPAGRGFHSFQGPAATSSLLALLNSLA